MGDSFSKKENFKKKAQKQKEKAQRREERKENNNKGKSLDDMIVYVDEFGRLTSTPPDQQRTEVDLEEIQLGAAPIIEEDSRKTGIVTFLSEKGYGFITENNSKENVFFHNNNCNEPVKKGNKVSFEKERSAKGFSAINIELVK